MVIKIIPCSVPSIVILEKQEIFLRIVRTVNMTIKSINPELIRLLFVLVFTQCYWNLINGMSLKKIDDYKRRLKFIYIIK